MHSPETHYTSSGDTTVFVVYQSLPPRLRQHISRIQALPSIRWRSGQLDLTLMKPSSVRSWPFLLINRFFAYFFSADLLLPLSTFLPLHPNFRSQIYKDLRVLIPLTGNCCIGLARGPLRAEMGQQPYTAAE